MDEFRKTECLELLEGIASVIVWKSGGKGEYLEKRQRLTYKSLAWVLVGRQSGFCLVILVDMAPRPAKILA